MIPFSLMWGGFAIFWEIMALYLFFSPHHQPARHPNFQWFALIFPLWGVPFVLIGLYMIFGRFFYDAATRQRTYFGVTDRRAIMVKSLFFRNVTSFDYATMTNLNLVERGDGGGDILFGPPTPWSTFSGASWPGSAGSKYASPGFYLVPDARNVYNLIREAQQRIRK
ncbi:MAG TPA: hypothetical protein VL981_06080 [Candidatus Methylacidiphilales bacterium]|nr:hypothetical protein [Candidatus Methylacidiphilales bacterium]